MARNKQLYEIVKQQKPTSIVEIGTWNGVNALTMVSIALQFNKNIHYVGYDLFDTGTQADNEVELNVKSAHSYDAVDGMFSQFKSANPGFTYKLIKGHTKDTLHGTTVEADLVFIDGGHSVETIQGDYEAVKSCKVIVFDDFYAPDEQGTCVDVSKYGCNELVNNLSAVILPKFDVCTAGGKVGMVVMPPQASPFPVDLRVKTKNCVVNKQIHANIKYSTTIVDNWLASCKPHDRTAYIVSAGPSYTDYLEELQEASKNPNNVFFCVKTNHDALINAGIIPFGCVLLDPRAKVRRFITPHKDVKYIAASMVHPSTIDLLNEYQIHLYNAVVNADEKQILDGASNNIRSKRFVCGGSTAAARALIIVRMLGFMKFRLYGYDSCYRTPQDPNETTKTGHKKFWEVEKFGKKFWTSLELLAQYQDFENLFGTLGWDPTYQIEAYGDGMIPHLLNTIRLPVEEYEEVFK